MHRSLTTSVTGKVYAASRLISELTMYAILADLVTTIHFAYVAFVVIAQLLILVGIVLRWKWIRNPWFRCIHLAMILIVALEAMGGIQCPLTVWDEQLRALA